MLVLAPKGNLITRQAAQGNWASGGISLGMHVAKTVPSFKSTHPC
jgi:hypothetical protein